MDSHAAYFTQFKGLVVNCAETQMNLSMDIKNILKKGCIRVTKEQLCVLHLYDKFLFQFKIFKSLPSPFLLFPAAVCRADADGDNRRS